MIQVSQVGYRQEILGSDEQKSYIPSGKSLKRNISKNRFPAKAKRFPLKICASHPFGTPFGRD